MWYSEVPPELEAECRREWGADVDSVRVSVVDKSSQPYTPPPEKPKPFDFSASGWFTFHYHHKCACYYITYPSCAASCCMLYSW